MLYFLPTFKKILAFNLPFNRTPFLQTALTIPKPRKFILNSRLPSTIQNKYTVITTTSLLPKS